MCRGYYENFWTLNLQMFNVGSDEQVSINQLIEMIENIASYKVDRKYDLSKKG